jgi:hypothetical protein
VNLPTLCSSLDIWIYGLYVLASSFSSAWLTRTYYLHRDK